MRDYGHDETERLISEMEKKVASVYRQSQKELSEKLDDYLKKFETKDKIWKKNVADGKRTLEEYKQWQKGQMLAGYRWQAMRDQIAEDLHNSNAVARSIVMGYRPEAYAINHNFATYQVEKAARVNTGYTLYSRETVERILRDQPELLPAPGSSMQKKLHDYKMKTGKDIAWQKGQIQSVMTQAVIQGESIPNISKRIAETLGEMNHKATIRYARTAITGAQNAGRMDAYKRASDMGIGVKQQWVATIDFRTRHEHRMLDQQIVEIGEPFEVDGYKIMFPADPTAEPEMIWNCRCTTIAVVEGLTHDFSGRSDEAIQEMSYDDWKESRYEESDSITKQEEIADIMKQRYINELYGGGSASGGASEAVEEVAQEQFVRAKTREEAEEYARRFSSSVDFKGISVENCNLINETLTKLTSKYPIKTLETIDGKPLRGAVASASYRGLSFSGKKLGAVLSEEQRVFDEMRASTQSAIEEIRKRYSGKKRIPSQVQSRIDRMESSIRYDRWCVQASYEDHVACIVTHEYGHVLSDQYFGMINDVKANANYATSMQLREMNAKWNRAYQQAVSSGDIYSLSKYGSKNAHEFFAESFVAYEKGEKLPDYITELFEEVFKNGIM